MEPVIRASKLHGLGNDFLVVLASENPGVTLPGSDEARRWCDRHRGVGADGLIVASGSEAIDIDVEMRLYNADGSLAEISGNGIRCLAHALARSEGRIGEFAVSTPGGLRRLVVEGRESALTVMVRVVMGAVGIDASAVALPSTVVEALGVDHGDRAAVGNPHIVIEVASLDGVDIADVGATVESAQDAGVNVHVAAVRADGGIDVVHWERGVGVTEACGSGATVTAAVLASRGSVSSPVEVWMPGGRAVVETGPEAVLVGPSEFIAHIEVPA